MKKLENEISIAFSAYLDNSYDIQQATILSVIKFLLPMQVAFRELLKLLQIALTIPVTTASCERSFSTLKRIKLRSRMGQDRLSSLAELAIEREMTNQFGS